MQIAQKRKFQFIGLNTVTLHWLSSCQYMCWNLFHAVLRGGHGTQAWSLTALIRHRFSHSEHKCGGKLRRIWQRPMSSGSWMNGPQYCTEWVHSHIEAGLLFKSSGRSHSMCTSPLRHGEQWDACTRPLLAYCRAGLLRPLGCLIKSETITFAGLSGKDACKKKKEKTRSPIIFLPHCS